MNACTDSCWSECLSLSFCVQFIANDGAVFVVQTDHNAANYCLMKIDVNKPDKVLFIMHDHWCTEVWLTHIFAATIFISPLSRSQSNWQMLVPPHDKDVLQWSACVNNTNLVMCYLRDVKVRCMTDTYLSHSCLRSPLAFIVSAGSSRARERQVSHQFSSRPRLSHRLLWQETTD